MDTFPVTPTPPQTFQNGTPAASSQSGNENGFAPSLAQAMSETTGSKNENRHQSAEDKSSTFSKNSYDIAENNNSEQKVLAKDQAVVADENGDMEEQGFTDPELSPITLLTAQHQTVSDPIPVKIADLLNRNNGTLSSQAISESPNNGNDFGKLTAIVSDNQRINVFQNMSQQDAVSSPPLVLEKLNSQNSVSPQQLNENTAGISAKETMPSYFGLARSTQNPDSAYRLNILPGNSNDLKQQILGQNTTNNPLTQITLGNEADTVSWSQSRQRLPHIIQQSLPVKVMYGGDTPVSKSTSSISTESIVASLTDLSLEVQAARPLRQEAPSLRQDINSQYFDAKLQRPELSAQTGSQENNLDAETQQNTQNSSLNLTLKTADNPSDLNFSQSLHQLSSEKLAQPSAEIFKPGMPFFNNPVFEDNIMHQVIQKMRINQQLQDSKIAIKLHPAELGELKIDIQIKEGSVNASIIAQNQTVQDILEKNMPKLKALMEQNGLKVNDIVVTLDTDVPSDFNLFEEHLAQNEDSYNKKKNSHSDAAFRLTQEEEESENTDTVHAEAGVNVKV